MHIRVNLQVCYNNCVNLDAKEGDFGLSNMEISERVVVRAQIENLLSLEGILWRQKSRMLCIKE